MSVRLGDEFWKERIEIRKREIAELKEERDDAIAHNEALLEQCNNAESQLGICFEIMTEDQKAQYQHLFKQSLHIPDSDSTNQTEGEN